MKKDILDVGLMNQLVQREDIADDCHLNHRAKHFAVVDPRLLGKAHTNPMSLVALQ
jgi:hypothetical protein